MPTATIGQKKLTFQEGTSQTDMDAAIAEYISTQQPEVKQPGMFDVPSQEQAAVQSTALSDGVPFDQASPPNSAFDDPEPPGFIESQLGSMGGSAIGSFMAANKAQQVLSAAPAPVRAAGTIAAGAAGAFAGGATGEATTQAANTLIGSRLAPESFREAAVESLQAGGEEALMDAAISSIFLAGGGAVQALRPLASDSAKAIKEILEKGGSNAALDQIVDKGVFKGVSQLTRDALIGSGGFKRLDAAQDVAITKYLDNYAETMTGKAITNLTDEGLGRFIQDTVQQGGKIHSEISRGLYTRLDDIVPNPTVATKTVQPAGLNQQLGAPAVVTEGTKEVGAVSMANIKRMAAEKLSQLARAGDIGKTVEGGELLEKIVALPDNVSFAAAHDIRSDVLFRKRALSVAKTGDPISKNLNDIIGAVDSKMDEAGKLLDPEGLKAYRAANKFYKYGQKNINNKMVKSLVSNELAPAKVGAAIARTTNTDLVRALRRSFRANATVTGKSFKELWGEVQGGFLGQTLPKTADEVANSPFLNLHKSEKARNTLRGLFTNEQQKSIIKLSEHLDTIVGARKGKGFLNLKQLGEVQKLGPLVQTAGLAASATAGGPAGMGAAAFFLAGPATFAKIATTPKLTEKVIRWSSAPTGTALKAKLGSQLAVTLGLSIADFEHFTGEKVRDNKNQLIPLK